MRSEEGALASWAKEHSSAVERVIRDVNASTVLRYFRQLTDAQISEKAAGERVTAADRHAEDALDQALTRLLPGSHTVGEEAVSLEPAIASRLLDERPAWIIDPIDGTENFITGGRGFATLVALAQRGRLIASWTYAPLLGLSATAVRGHGAVVNGRRAGVALPRGAAALEVSFSRRTWWRAETYAWAAHLASAGATESTFDTAGLAYVELATGRRRALLLQWESVWDHAAGMLLLREAGGAVRAADGRDFRLAGGNTLPMVAAASAGEAHEILTLLAPGNDGPHNLEDATRAPS